MNRRQFAQATTALAASLWLPAHAKVNPTDYGDDGVDWPYGPVSPPVYWIFLKLKNPCMDCTAKTVRRVDGLYGLYSLYTKFKFDDPTIIKRAEFVEIGEGVRYTYNVLNAFGPFPPYIMPGQTVSFVTPSCRRYVRNEIVVRGSERPDWAKDWLGPASALG